MPADPSHKTPKKQARQFDRHRPLTLCLAANLDWSRPGTPASDEFGDIYFSVEGGLDETRAVYLSACGLPQRWQDSGDSFTIAELGFGTGLNFLATWQSWLASEKRSRHLHFVSVEKYPLSKEQLSKALENWPELAGLSAQLIDVWPGRVRGYHRLHFGDVTLTLIHEDVSVALGSADFRADAWYLDGFSPARNPDMWSPEVLSLIGDLSANGAMVGTFTAAGAVREGLRGAGFDVEKVAGFGRKRHRIQAVMRKPADEIPKVRSPIIIGAGIAGASLARAFLSRGIIPTVIDAGDDTAASGNPAAIVKPRLDRQDKDDSRFFLSSYLYALQAYKETNGILSKGVFHAATTDDLQDRFKDLAHLGALPADHLVWTENGPYGLPGLSFPTSLTINPSKVCADFLEGTRSLTGQAVRVDKQGGDWRVIGADGDVIAAGSHVIFAIGAGVRELPIFDALGLRYNRGQLTWTETAKQDSGVINYGGYAINLGNATLLGATHEPVMDGQTRADIYTPSEDDDARNIDGFAAISGEVLKKMGEPSRVSVRVNTAQTWPVIAHIDVGVSAMTGLGSRGFVFAPLLAEAMVSGLCGEPSVMPKGLFVT